jgi:uncharacterized protein (DUF934 family)
MPKIIKDGGIVDDPSRIVDADADVDIPTGTNARSFLPLPAWLASHPGFEGFAVPPGVWIEANENIDVLELHMADVPAIAIRFNSFSDGTGFSIGAMLREVQGFEGELRAFGDLIADQVPQLRRCGFNAIALKEGECLETALSMLLGTKLTYQGSVYSPRTPFKFRF